MPARVPTHAEYLAASDAIAAGLSASEAERLASGRLAEARERLRLLDLDAAAPLLLSLYSQTTGRPANDPTVYVRSLALMLRLGYTSVQRWVDDARGDRVLQCLVGTTEVPAASATTTSSTASRATTRTSTSPAPRGRPPRPSSG